MNHLPHTFTISADEENFVPATVRSDERHVLNAAVDTGNRDIYLSFTSRDALFGFAMSLLQSALHGKGGQQEFFPLVVNGKSLIVDGVRMSEDSSRIFVSYPHD